MVASYGITVLFGLYAIVSMICNETGKFGMINVGVNIGPDRILLVLLLWTFCVKYAASGKRVGWILEEKIIFIFFLVLLASCIVGGAIFAPKNRFISKLIGFSLLPGFLFMIARRLDYDERCLRGLRNCLFVIGVYLAFTALMEHLHYDALIFPKYILDKSVGIHFGRVRGPFVQSAMMGGAMCTVALWLIWYHVNVEKSRFTWILFFFLMAGCYWTDTRGVWLHVAASLTVLGIMRNPLRKPVRVLFLVAVLIFFSGIASKFSPYRKTLFNERKAQVDDRKNIFYASWEMFMAKPLFGFGYGNFLKYSDNYFAQLKGVELRGMGEGQHNTLLGLLSETGLSGTVPFVCIYYLFFRKLWRRYKEAGEAGDELNRSLALAMLAILAGIVVSGQVSDFGFYTYINNLAFWLIGMVYASLPAEAEAEPSEEVESLGEPVAPTI